MLNALRQKLRQLFRNPESGVSVRCFGSDLDGNARSAFLLVLLSTAEMSQVFGKLVCRFDLRTRTLTVVEAHFAERWRQVSTFRQMLEAAIRKCRAQHVVIEDPGHGLRWIKLHAQEVAGARIHMTARSTS